MRFTAEAERFLKPGADRLVALAGLLAARGLGYSVVRTGEARHVLLRVGGAAPALAFIAHYDRYPGSPGALDNSCACLQLADFAARASAALSGAAPSAPAGARRGMSSFLVAFTDAEEAPGHGQATEQGSFALARALQAAAGAAAVAGAAAAAEGLAALVFDVTGRGGRLLLSSAPASLLARHGLGGSPAALGHSRLLGLARRAAQRAGLARPFEAELPWSDDLGLTLAGMPSLTVSLLPEAEAELLRGGGKPPTWELLHTEEDSPDKAEEGAFALMSAYLDELARTDPEYILDA
jgi:hypothetical protein